MRVPSESKSEYFSGDTSIDIHLRLERLVSRSHKRCESSDRVLRTFSRGDYSCRECIPVPNGVWKETVLINVSSSIVRVDCVCKGTRYTFRGGGGNSVKIYFTPFRKGVYSKRKEFAPLGSKFFPLRVDFFYHKDSPLEKILSFKRLSKELGLLCRKANRNLQACPF